MKLTENFNLDEFYCNDGTSVPNEYLDNVMELAKNLQVLRDEIGIVIDVISGYRTPEYNSRKDVKGKRGSRHLTAQAADIVTRVHTPQHLAFIIERLIKEKRMKQGGVGIYPSFVHYDVRGTKARW